MAVDKVHLIRGVGNTVKKNVVMLVALVAAVITCFFVPPDKAYLGYFDLKTLTCLFCVLAVVCALKNINFFYMLAKKIVRVFKNTRMSILALVYITFLGSMLIANDMALLTFLPLGLYVLTSTGKGKYMAFTFVMQNIAANLGGMLTPFGNPQNLYLYTKFQIPNLEFMGIMAPPFVLSVARLVLLLLLVALLRSGYFKAISSEAELEAYIARWEPWSQLAFFGVQLISVILAPIPSNITAAVGGVLFGTVQSFLLTWAAVVIGSMAVFVLARVLGQRFVQNFVGKKISDKYLDLIRRKRDTFLLLAFLFPFFPDDIICILAGLTDVSWKRFLVARLM